MCLLAVTLCAAVVPDVIADEGVLSRLGLELGGFVDLRGGRRLQSDANERDTSLAEARLQLDISRFGDFAEWRMRADVLWDDIPEDRDLDLDSPYSPIDLREASIAFSPTDIVDVRAGRQILTWGTGDLLFINDLFPKDWQSFFCGRDDEYLKAPSDALFVSFYPPLLNVDVVYTPRFDPDRYITGARLSYWNAGLCERAGRDAVVQADEPDDWFRDDELSVRLSREVAGWEGAIYWYDGFWKSPAGVDSVTGIAIFPELSVFGASMRGTVGAGLFSIEAGYYLSSDDSDGSDFTIRNSETRLLAGYEQELVRNLTGSVQVYLEMMDDYAAYRASLPDGQAARDEDRLVLSLRLTQLMMSQNLVLSFFGYYSPTDRDAYLRPSMKYALTDKWQLFGGVNVFSGAESHTFFGQFEKNTNVYGGARYLF